MAGESVLVIGESLRPGDALHGTLTSENLQVFRASRADDAISRLRREVFHVVVVEYEALGPHPARSLEKLAEADPDASILLISASRAPFDARWAGRFRTVATLQKPLDAATVLTAVETALFQRKLVQENRALKQKLRDLFTFNDWVGASTASTEIRRALGAAALSRGPVLFSGEAGSGRRLAAELVHDNGPEADAPFLPLDLEKLPPGELPHLLNALGRGEAPELRGAPGNGATPGCVYLREPGALEPSDQAALASLLEREFPFRILASTSPDRASSAPGERVLETRLRERLTAIVVAIPPLRERLEDIPLLVDLFLRRFCDRLGIRRFAVAPRTIEKLSRYHWPGNVAELAMVIERAVAIASAAKLDSATLPEQFCEPPTFTLPEARSVSGQSLKDLITDIERRIIIQTLESVSGSQKRAAEMLRLKPTTLHEKMKRYKILPDKVRSPFKSFLVGHS